MATATELLVAHELAPLQEIARDRGWKLEIVDATTFRLILPAKDDTDFQLEVHCDGYPTRPPAWHFRNPGTGLLDRRADVPHGGQFFHGAGVICAPWNRLAYVAPGPHPSDWSIGDWKTNQYTLGTKTLCAMALRIHRELRGPYAGRLENA